MNRICSACAAGGLLLGCGDSWQAPPSMAGGGAAGAAAEAGSAGESGLAGAAGSGGSVGTGGNVGTGGQAIDRDLDYPDRSERLYLSGRGTDDAVAWEFMINSGARAGEWATLPVPSNWEFHGFGTFQYGFNPSDELGTYRHSFELPASWAGRQIFLFFEGSMTDTQVSVNGMSAGPTHQGAFYRFQYDVTPLLRPGANELEVLVAEQSSNASVNAAEREADYWTFGGIFRPVYLEASPPQAIERFALDARADGSLSVEVTLRGSSEDATLTARVLDDALSPLEPVLTTSVPAGATRATLSGSFPGAATWSAEQPKRHRLAVELETASGARHALRDNFGFRTLEVRPGDGIYVNGTRVLLRGVNRHCFWPDSGRALNAALSLADVQLLKDMNMNAVRSSHYPPDEHFLDYADALGLFVLDELAGWQSPPYETEVGRKLVGELVSFDVNHPSILFWDNGNEGGWNTELDADFGSWDPQRRPVLHPWATFSGINTDHYESYASTVAILSGPTLFMPTELLHGLYDGGGGSGLDDYWAAIRKSPRGAGAFLWAFIDEGVRRSPTQVDTAGNAAPDGILGPAREKEGSYYTVRDIWSPVQIALPALPGDFSGEIPLENQYDFTDLNQVRFEWQLVDFDFEAAEGGHSQKSSGEARTDSIAPHASGTLQLPLPVDFRDAQALLLEAFDAQGRSVGNWSWMIPSPSELRTQLVDTASPSPAASVDTETELTVTAAGRAYTFDKSNGQLSSVSVDGVPYPFNHGPALAAGTAVLATFTSEQDQNDVLIDTSFTGDLQQVEWRVLGNGWLQLYYRYALAGSFDYFGVSFDCDEAEVEGARWLGRGPHRVWKNRLRGPWHDLWSREKNSAITGQRWEYPEFEGYFADVFWARLATSAGPIEVVMDSPGIFLRLFTPANGVNPQQATMSFPAQDISFLHGVAPIGDKFLAAAALGPQGEPHALNDTFEATLYFWFGSKPAE